jgi:hypothetical protein
MQIRAPLIRSLDKILTPKLALFSPYLAIIAPKMVFFRPLNTTEFHKLTMNIPKGSAYFHYYLVFRHDLLAALVD